MMNEKQVEDALKLALEALEVATTPLAKDRQEVLRAITAIREALADSALERMAENARELGLDYEPAPVAKPHEQQEPVAVVSGYYGGQCVVLPTNPAMLFNSGTAFYTSPPASKPHGFAGVTAWIGDATVTRIVTRVQIQHERVAGQSMTQAARVCLDMLAAHGIKGKT